MTPILLAVLLSQAPEPEIFLDRGETYVRMGYSQGLTKGVTVDVVAAQGGKAIGTAVVMEVWDGLARVSLDTASTAFKGLRLARLRGAPVSPPPQAEVAPAPALPGAPPQPPAAAAPKGKVLQARVQISGGLVDARRFIIYNLDSYDWHNCKIRLPDGRGYDRMSELRAGADEGIMMFRFEPGMALRDASGLVTVACSEGVGRFPPQF